jgi:transposase
VEILLTNGAVLPCIQEKTMSRRPRRNHLPAFKAKVALEAAKEEMTTSELSQKYDVSPNQITDWKRQLLDRATEVFEKGPKSDDPPVDVKTLHAKIGELTLENDFLEGALTKAGLLSAKR